MDDEKYLVCKSLVKNMAWFVQRKKQYLEVNYETFASKHDDKVDVYKELVEEFGFESLDLLLVLYFQYVLENKEREENPLSLEVWEEKFLMGKDELECLFDNEELEVLRRELLKEKLVDLEVVSITEKVTKLKVTSKIVIENLSGLEDDLDDWFDKFEIKSDAADWTDDVKGIRLPAYLTDLALVVWKTQAADSRADYRASKAHILKELVDDTTLEQKFYSRKQKDCETVLEFYYKITSESLKIFVGDGQKERRKPNVLKLFWNGLKLDIRKLVIGSGTPTVLDKALELAKNAERFLCESRKEAEKLIAATASKPVERASRSPVHDERAANLNNFEDRKRSNSPGALNGRARRSSTPYQQGSRNGVFKCFRCGKEGHMSRECPSNQGRDTKQAYDGRTCFYCKQVGHIADKCNMRLTAESKKSLKE